jgi:hypothetical protein
MSSSPHAQRPIMRSYYVPAPTPSPFETLAKAVLAFGLVGASAIGIVSITRGSAGGSTATPTAAGSISTEEPPADLAPSLLAGTVAPEPSALPLFAEGEPSAVAPSPLAGDAASAPRPATIATVQIADLPAPPAPEAVPASPEPSAEFVLPPMPPTFETGRTRLVVEGGPTVNVRAEPSTISPVLMALFKGATVEEVPNAPRSAGPDWRYVRWNGREGWIAASLVRVDTVPLQQVPAADQGIDYWHPLKEGVFPLREISTGRPIVDGGQPVYVDLDGSRVAASAGS